MVDLYVFESRGKVKLEIKNSGGLKFGDDNFRTLSVGSSFTMVLKGNEFLLLQIIHLFMPQASALS